MSYHRSLSGDVRSPTSTSTEVRSPTSTSTEVRSPTSTSTEVRSPTSTSTDAYTAGNVTVTGGAGAGAYTNVSIYGPQPPRTASSSAEHAAWRAGRMTPVVRATPDGYLAQDTSALTARARATDNPDKSRSLVPRATGDIELGSMAKYAALAIGGLLVYRHVFKRRRR